MAPKGSRTPLWLPLLISVVAALGLLLVVFHSGLLAAVQNVVSIGPPVLSSHRSQSGPASNRLPSKTVTFGAHPLLETFSPSADEDWEQMLLPRKGGFLWVAYNETSDEAWGIGMFHALHCLKMLRKAIRSEPMKNSRGVSDSAGSEYRSERRAKPTLGHPDLSPNHLGHCIGYIAQHLLCAADSTIEPPWLKLDHLGNVVDAGVNGQGYQHQCRDPSLLWQTVQRSEKAAIEPWDWRMGDTVESTFGE